MKNSVSTARSLTRTSSIRRTPSTTPSRARACVLVAKWRRRPLRQGRGSWAAVMRFRPATATGYVASVVALAVGCCVSWRTGCAGDGCRVRRPRRVVVFETPHTRCAPSRWMNLTSAVAASGGRGGARKQQVGTGHTFCLGARDRMYTFRPGSRSQVYVFARPVGEEVYLFAHLVCRNV